MYGHKYVFGKYNIGYQGNYERAPYICTSSYLTKSAKILKSEKWLDRYHAGQGHNVEQKFIVKKYLLNFPWQKFLR